MIDQKNKLNTAWLAASLLLVVIVLPFGAVWAADTGLVPCTDDCGWNDLIKLFDNILKWIVMIAVPVASILAVYGGGMIVLSPAEPGKRSQAKSIFKAGVIGLVAVLAAFLIIDTILSELTTQGVNQRLQNAGLNGSTSQ